MVSGRKVGSLSCDLQPVYSLGVGELGGLGEQGEKDFSRRLFLQCERLGEGEEGGTGEVGVDEEVGHFMFGKDPFFQAGLGELGDTVSSLSCLAAYQSGISSLPSDSFTLSVGAR